MKRLINADSSDDKRKLERMMMDIKDESNKVLRNAFYKIPDIDVSTVGDSTVRVEFELSPTDTKWFTASNLKKALKPYGKVTQSRFKHDRLTGGYTVFTYDVEVTL